MARWRKRLDLDVVLVEVVRLNDKTVTLLCGQQQWRVAYAYLYRIVDSDLFEHDLLEIKGTPLQAN